MQFARVKNKTKQNSVPKSLPLGTGFFLVKQARIDLQSNVFPCRRYSTAVTIMRNFNGQPLTATKAWRIVKPHFA